MLCDNAAKRTGNLVSGVCFDNAAEEKVVITYNQVEESDSLHLCRSCANTVQEKRRVTDTTSTGRRSRMYVGDQYIPEDGGGGDLIVLFLVTLAAITAFAEVLAWIA